MVDAISHIVDKIKTRDTTYLLDLLVYNISDVEGL
jgi:hypothetical protein